MAEQDFYGIQMKSEGWARNLMMAQPLPQSDAALLAEGPILSQNVHAEASLKDITETSLDLTITVYNDSDLPIHVDYELRDFFIQTRDGRKYSLIDVDEDSPTIIDPRSKLSFSPSTGNLRIKNADVEMIICSFDLGRTRLFLFPWSKKTAVSKLTSPEAPAPPVEAETASSSTQKAPKRSKAPDRTSEPRSKTQEPQGPDKKTPKRDFWDWFKLRKESEERRDQIAQKVPVKPTAVERSSAAPAAAPAAKTGGLDSAIKNFVYVPSSGNSGPSGDAPVPGAARSEAHVIDVNRQYNFITLNIGQNDGLQKDTLLSVVREGKLVAKAKVKQVREAVAAAVIVPETMRSEVRSGDKITLG